MNMLPNGFYAAVLDVLLYQIYIRCWLKLVNKSCLLAQFSVKFD